MPLCVIIGFLTGLLVSTWLAVGGETKNDEWRDRMEYLEVKKSNEGLSTPEAYELHKLQKRSSDEYEETLFLRGGVVVTEDQELFEVKMIRAEREGQEAVYELYYAELRKLADKANQTKDAYDLKKFEEEATKTFDYFKQMIEKQYAEKYGWLSWIMGWKISRRCKEELAKINGLLDDSLRNL